MTPNAPTVGALVFHICTWIDRLFPDAERGGRLKRALGDRFGNDARAVTEDLCREVEAVAHGFSRHLALEYVADGSLVPDEDPPGWPPQDRHEVERRAGSVGAVTRRPDGVGVLALNGLDGVHIAAPYLEGAFALLRGARGVVLDVRSNGGGDPGTVMLVLDWLLGGEATHIADVIYRDRTRQWWTTGRLGNLALPRETPVSVLVGERTFSSGEALAYHLQSRRRGPVVLLPEARVRDAVTAANWEGTGVVPDVPCEPADALTAAIEALNRGSSVDHDTTDGQTRRR
jgi:hypothetical protein